MNNRYRSRFHAQQASHGMDSGRSSPAYSNLSDLENESTDDFGKRLIQDAKESQRLRNALRRPNSNAQHFDPSQSRRRPGLTQTSLARQNRLGHVQHIQHGSLSEARDGYQGGSESPPSGSSVASEPSVQVPREWGRRGRQQPDWLRRRIQPEDVERSNGGKDINNIDNVFQSRRPRTSVGYSGSNDTPNIDWTAAAVDVPLPSVEDSPLASRNSTPANVHHNDSLEQIRDLEFSEEFSVGDLLASTPAAITRNSALDEIRIREFQNTNPSSTSTHTRHEQRRSVVSPSRRSNGFLSRKSLSTSPEKHQSTLKVSSSPPKWLGSATKAPTPSDAPRGVAPGHDGSKDGVPHGKDTPVDSGEPVNPADPTSPVLVYKASDLRPSSAGHTLQDRPRLDQKRVDSHDTLRMLARVASMSPSPRNTPESDSPDTKSKNNASRSRDEPEPDTRRKNLMGGSQSTKQNVQEQVGTHENSTRPNIKTPRSTSHDYSKSERSTDRMKTPKVTTGGWIDTPKTEIADNMTLNRRSLSKDSQSAKDKPVPETKGRVSRISPKKPTLPRSALSAVLANSHGNALNPDFGEDTIDSLQSLITSPTLPSFDFEHSRGRREGNQSQQSQQGQDDKQPSNKDSNKDSNVYAEAQARRDGEVQALHDMNERLRLTRTSIRDARRGVRKMESKVEGLTDENEWDSDENFSSDSDDESAVAQPREGSTVVRTRSRSSRRRSSSHHHCHCCREGWFEKNFRKFRRLFWRNGHWTYLGWFWWGFVIWVVLEIILCSIYCRQEFARSMVGYGIDPYAPEVPYVTCTIFYRKLIQPFSFLYWPIWVLVRETIKRTYSFLSGSEFPWKMLTQEEIDTQWKQQRAAAKAQSQSQAQAQAQAHAHAHASESMHHARMTEEEEFNVLKDMLYGLARWGRGSDSKGFGSVGTATRLGSLDDVGVLGQDEVL